MIKSSPSASTTASWNRIALLLLICVISALPFFLLINVSPTQAAVNCNANSWNIGNQSDLNVAINCFNGKVTGGIYTISLTQNISLTASTSEIINGVTGVELLLEGNHNTVDGQELVGVRPFTIQGSNTNVTIQNTTITGGNVNVNGGAIYTSGALTVSNSILIGNIASTSHGGGIYNDAGTLTINNSTFVDNSATNGGGINNNTNGTLIVNNSTFSSNSASVGGAIINYSSNNNINDSTFANNSATAGGQFTRPFRLQYAIALLHTVVMAETVMAQLHPVVTIYPVTRLAISAKEQI